MVEVAIGCIGLHFLDSIYIVARRANVRIHFNCVRIARMLECWDSCVGRIHLPYCCCTWKLSQSIFVYLLIAHLLRLSLSIRVKIYLDRVNTATGRCIFFSISAVPRQPLDVWVYIYINMTILILPLGVCIEIATGLMSSTVSGTVIPLGVYNKTVTGRVGSLFQGLY